MSDAGDERTWETDAPAAEVTVCWGDALLFAEQIAPPRGLDLGGAGAGVVVPDGLLGAESAPLLLGDGGALWLVLLPAMDPGGIVTLPGRAERTVGDLGRPGMSEPYPGVPGAFRVPLPRGARATLSIGELTITVVAGKAARAVAGHFHVSRRMVPFQIASGVLHLGLLGACAFLMPPLADDLGEPTAEQMVYMAESLRAVAMKEEAEDPDGEGSYAPATYYGGGWATSSMDYLSSLSEMPSGSRRPKREREEGSYARVRRALRDGEAPEAGSVHTGEIVDAVSEVPAVGAASSEPFSVTFAAAPSPFTPGHHLIRVGVRASREPSPAELRDLRDVHVVVEPDAGVLRAFRHLGDESRDGDDFPAGDVIAHGHGVNAVYDVVFAHTGRSPVTVRIRHERLFGGTSFHEQSFPMPPSAVAPSLDAAPAGLRLAFAAVGFAEILRGDERADGWRLADVERLCRAAAGDRPAALDLCDLARAARAIDEAPPSRSAWTGPIGNASLMRF